MDNRFRAWLPDQRCDHGPRFTDPQLKWLNMIKDHIAGSIEIGRDAFDYNPFAQAGCLGRAYELFGEDLDRLMNQLTEVLAA